MIQNRFIRSLQRSIFRIWQTELHNIIYVFIVSTYGKGKFYTTVIARIVKFRKYVCVPIYKDYGRRPPVNVLFHEIKATVNQRNVDKITICFFFMECIRMCSVVAGYSYNSRRPFRIVAITLVMKKNWGQKKKYYCFRYLLVGHTKPRSYYLFVYT